MILLVFALTSSVILDSQTRLRIPRVKKKTKTGKEPKTEATLKHIMPTSKLSDIGYNGGKMSIM